MEDRLVANWDNSDMSVAKGVSMTSRSRVGSKDEVSSSVLVADTKLAEGGSETTLWMPRLPRLTGSDVWVQRLSPMSMFNVVNTVSRRMASNFGNSGLPMHGAVLRRYISRGAVSTYRCKYKLSCDGMGFNQSYNSCKID